MMDWILMRSIERIAIVIGAIFIAYLGYRLYALGVEKGHSNLTAESRFYKFIFSGSGPGLFFMAFGSIVLVTALFTGVSEERKVTENSPATAVNEPVNSIFEAQQEQARLVEYHNKMNYEEDDKGEGDSK